MAAYVGGTAPSTFYVGSTQATAMYVGSTLVYSAAPAVWPTQYSDTFTGTTGTAPAAAWKKATAYPTTGAVTIQANAMRITSGSTAAWTGAGSVFLGDPATPQGATGIPAIAANAEYTFDYTLLNLTQHYPSIAVRARSAEAWPSGDGQNVIKTGYSLVLGPSGNSIDLIEGYSTATIATIPYTFPSNALKFRIKVSGKWLYLRIWAASVAEPATWTYSAAVLQDESDGSIAFVVPNGVAAEQRTVTIDNFTSTTPTLSLGSSVQAPTTDPAGFTRIFTENFDTVAPVGTGTGGFIPVYAQSFQPYDETTTTSPRLMISAHDGVMDVNMDGTHGSAGWFGTTTNGDNRIGGRFTMRAKAIGAFNNGPAIMIWPSSGVWAEGEVDFPESVSGNGGTQGFQDSPWIHQHSMVVGSEANAQDVALGVSWRDWHVYSVEWKAGTSANVGGYLKYYVDEVLVYTSTTDIPFTNHRFTYQVGNWGAAGHLYIDWVTISTIN